MIIDLGKEGEGVNSQEYDVCIVGSGPAGIALTNVLADYPLKICLLESGDFSVNPIKDLLRLTESEGIHIKDYSRERVVGGCSTTWSGLSAPLDRIDFENRSWVDSSGWPIAYEDLVPFYKEASERFRFPSWDKFIDSDWALKGDPISRELLWQNLKTKVFVAPNEPQQFAKEFGDAFQNHGVDLISDATVTHLEGSSETGRVTIAIAKNRFGKEFGFQARLFVLACGGIENSRLLFNSTFACANGLGNDKDQLGRYFLNHPKNNFGVVQLTKPIEEMPAYFGQMNYQSGVSVFNGLRAKEKTQREVEILNSYIRLQPVFRWSNRKSIESLIWFIKKSRLYFQIIRRISNRNNLVSLRDYAETGDDTEFLNKRKTFLDQGKMILHIFGDFPMVSRYAYSRLFPAPPRIQHIAIRNFMEMGPCRSNRIVLADARDKFGNRIPKVVHSPSDQDKYSMESLHRLFDDDLRKNRFGKFVGPKLTVNTQPWPVDYDASHHMGGTRMGRDPNNSVVNPDCRLHFSPNLYVAGSSVFPTSGNANPTYTIIALAIRLGKHLNNQCNNNE